MCNLNDDLKNEIRKAFEDGELKVNSVNVNSGETEMKPVSDIMRHTTPHKKIVQIVTEKGRVVKCTEDHSLFTVDQYGLPSPVEADSLKEGSSLVVVKKGLHSFSSERIRSVLYLPSEKYTFDLSVPHNENFVLTSGVLAHNSYSIGGVSLDIQKSSKYEGIKNNAESQLDKMLQAKERTVKIIRGLKQSRYGAGVRSSFGPHTGHGVLTPAKYMGI